jgi:hypothetical protein
MPPAMAAVREALLTFRDARTAEQAQPRTATHSGGGGGGNGGVGGDVQAPLPLAPPLCDVVYLDGEHELLDERMFDVLAPQVGCCRGVSADTVLARLWCVQHASQARVMASPMAQTKQSTSVLRRKQRAI